MAALRVSWLCIVWFMYVRQLPGAGGIASDVTNRARPGLGTPPLYARGMPLKVRILQKS